ncbi:uncharacterized protein C14orf93-like [Alosa sapidissima]|uniref:uncharacterized protein C14orf93-like n=1 Tax=Alosa sapidissima TaxID=34773 RepID=UPI001C09906D|nr:uncharacterized protein C14orf93-like [Alosa sapidissima]
MSTPRRSPNEIANAWRRSSRQLSDEEEHASINTSLRDVLRAMGDIRSSIDDLRGDLKQLQDTVTGMGQQPSSSTNNKVPHELSARVRRIHRGLGEELQWRVGPNDIFRSSHNEEVTKAIIQAIKDSGETWGPENLLRKACNKFFENLKTQMRLELSGRVDEIKNKKKLVSRRDRLFKRRLQVGGQVLEGEDLLYLQRADAAFMSDEESGEEDKGTFVVLPPKWRTTRLTRILHQCQKQLETNGRLGRKPGCLRQRVQERGRVSSRDPPTGGNAMYIDLSN